jgi:hypothetical protein
MLGVVVVCALVGAVMLAYAPSHRPLAWRRMAVATAVGAALGVAALAAVRSTRADAGPLALALGLVYVPAGVLALVPRFRQSPHYDRARPLVWAWSLVVVGLVAGASLAVQEEELTIRRGNALGAMLEQWRAAHGRYPERLSQLRGDLGRGFSYWSDTQSYRVAFPAHGGAWLIDSQRHDWRRVAEVPTVAVVPSLDQIPELPSPGPAEDPLD